MPAFLEAKLKQEYGTNSTIPFKVMNAQGYMRGNQETQKGKDLQAQHERDDLVHQSLVKSLAK